MLLPIGELDAAALERLRGLLARASWQDGRGTAGVAAARGEAQPAG